MAVEFEALDSKEWSGARLANKEIDSLSVIFCQLYYSLKIKRREEIRSFLSSITIEDM